MFGKIKNSWRLAKECWRVLMLDKEMMAFPLFSAFFNAIILAAAYLMMSAAGLIRAGGEFVVDESSQWQLLLLGAVTTAALYFVINFFHAALVASAIIRFRGDDPTVNDGLSIAAKRVSHILVWSVISILLGIVMAVVQSLFKSKFMQSVVGNLFETGWNVLTVFVVPLMVAENLSPLAAMARSRTLLKQGWGESLGLEVGFSWLATLMAVPTGILFFVTLQIANTSPAVALVFGLIAVAVTVVLCLIFSALNGISKAAIYNFANGDKVPDILDQDVLGNVIVRRT